MLKRIAIVDDIVSYGKCSLGISLPILSAAGVEVYPAITGVYSAHTPIKGYVRQDTSDIFSAAVKNWEKQKVNFDVVFTGALADKAQAYTCQEIFTTQKRALKVVDPVLGDFGDFYDESFKELLPHVKLMCTMADIITPNITEAQLMSGTTTHDPNQLLIDLKKLGAKNIVLTGVVDGTSIKNYLLNEYNELHVSAGDYYDTTIHGAGDVFGSSLVASIIKGRSIQDALDFATKITSEAVANTIQDKDFAKKGIIFENLIDNYTKL